MSATNQTSNSYDEIPYSSGAYRQSHPDHLAALATLFGMSPRDIHSCRVLEIGCANGANLLPMASTLPHSTFIGIDLSAKQIAEGQGWARDLQLGNVELHHLDLSELGQRFGKFDYIIAHGVYSWVPAGVREHLLAACRDCLHEQGVAYVSYNTNPGWGMRGTLRDMMLYHSRKFPDAREQIGQARALIHWLAEVVQAEGSPYGMLLQQELERMKSWRDEYLRHDSLEEVNEPVYFHQFVDQAESHSLKYLAEADLPSMFAGNYDEKVNAKVHQLGGDIIELEQYMDFVRNRMFRQTLLCHRSVPLDRALNPSRLTSFHFVSSLRPISENPDLTPGQIEEFRCRDGSSATTNQPIAKAAFVTLSERSPDSLSFADLLTEVRSRLEKCGLKPSPDIGANREAMGSILLQCIFRGFCEIHRFPPQFQMVPGERPKACPIAAFQADRSWFVTNRRHECITLDELGRHLLSLLDGVRTRGDIAEELARLADSGELEVKPGDTPVTDPVQLRGILKQKVDEQVMRLGRCALLVS
ncbi:MAG TPA: class I SAM-dependent methyltransferase [Verrucomicrobiae bacterium]|nr:class I SAM-dependent methyltransferase [Verrucomicrobiae bacterium]